jgi:hypothetical protein
MSKVFSKTVSSCYHCPNYKGFPSPLACLEGFPKLAGRLEEKIKLIPVGFCEQLEFELTNVTTIPSNCPLEDIKNN